MKERLQERYEGLAICKLGHDEVQDIYGLMLDVVSRLPDKDMFVTDDMEYFHSLLEQNGEIYGAYDKDKLVAYSVLAYPGTGSKNLGREFGVPDDELSRVWVFDAVIVHETVRGMGLQRYFFDLIEKRAREMGGKHLYATVHPDNEASRRNMEKSRLNLQFTRPMYGGLPRHCYAKRI